jgi:hypothetical protein
MNLKDLISQVSSFVQQNPTPYSYAKKQPVVNNVSNYMVGAAKDLYNRINPQITSPLANYSPRQFNLSGVNNFIQRNPAPINLITNPIRQSIQNFGMQHPNAAGMILKSEPIVNKTKSFLSNPYKPVGLPNANLSSSNPYTNAALKVPQVAYNYLAKPLLEGAINAPTNYVGGVTRSGLDLGRMARGEKVPVKQTLADLSSVAKGIMDVSVVPGVAGIAKNTIKSGEQGILNAVKQGAISGAKFGGAYGGLQSLIDNKDIQDTAHYLTNVLSGTAIGGIGGAVLGGGVAGASYTAGKVISTTYNFFREKGLTHENAIKETKIYIRDKLGQFAEKTGETATELRQRINNIKVGGMNGETTLGEWYKQNGEAGFVRIPELSNKDITSRTELRSLLNGMTPKEVKALKNKSPQEYKQVLQGIVDQLFPEGAPVTFAKKKGTNINDLDHFLSDVYRQEYIKTLPQTYKSQDIKFPVSKDKTYFIKKYFDNELKKDVWDLIVQKENAVITKIPRLGNQGRGYVESKIVEGSPINDPIRGIKNTPEGVFNKSLEGRPIPSSNMLSQVPGTWGRKFPGPQKSTDTIIPPKSNTLQDFLDGKINDVMDISKSPYVMESGGVGEVSNLQPTGKAPLMETGKLPQQVEPTTIKPQLPRQELQNQKSQGGMLPNGQRNPSSPNSIPPESNPVQVIIDALKGAKPLEQKQAGIYAKIRSQQAGAVAGVGKSVPGEAGYFAQLCQLKGEMPKVQFESLRKQVTQPDIDSLFNKVEQSYLSPFEKVTAKSGLAKLLGAEGGSVPVKSELKLLNEIFPPEFIQSVLDKRPMMEKLFAVGENALNLPRAMMATADLSAPMRQGVFFIGKPKQWIPAFRDMFKYAFSEKAYKGLQENIKSRPTYQLMRENKLALTDMGSILGSREEMFMSNLSEKIPGFGAIAKGSNRAYSGFLNKLRADVFDDLYKTAKSQGLTTDNPKLVADIAKFVNSATGRGDLGALNKASVVLNGLFFSPRLMASRLNLLNPVYYARLEPFVRKEALKSLFTFAGTAMSILGLAKLGGAEVGVDPRSADFGKIKVGDTRFDPWGGFQQYLVMASRLITGEMVSSTSGKEFKLGEGYKPTTRLDIIQRFFESKEAPVASFITSLLKGQTAVGEKVKLSTEIIDRFIPMVWQDMYDLYKSRGPQGIGMALPGVFGVGSQTYTDQIPMTGKTATGKPNVQWRQAPGLGETLLNKITGNQVSDIPKEQWQPLVDQKQKEALWNIEYSALKSKVLETGETSTIKNPLNGKTMQVYLDNGVVKTKDITPKDTTTKKSSSIKIKKAKAAKKVTLKLTKPKKIQNISIKLSKPKTIKLKKLAKLKLTKPKKIVNIT